MCSRRKVLCLLKKGMSPSIASQGFLWHVDRCQEGTDVRECKGLAVVDAHTCPQPEQIFQKP